MAWNGQPWSALYRRREPAVRPALMDTGWRVLSLEYVVGRVEPWLFVMPRTGRVSSKIPRHLV